MRASDWEGILADVPALTVRNPWALYIAHYGKNVENRVWEPKASVSKLLIHAGLGWDEVPADLRPSGDLGNVHVGAIVALTTIVGVCDKAVDGSRCQCGKWAVAGQFHWRLDHTIALPTPVPDRGKLGLWRPRPLVVAAVSEQLALSATAGPN